MVNIHKRLHTRLTERAETGNFRELTTITDLVDFSSNDYLGLASNAVLRDYTLDYHKSHRCALGATGSRLLTGNSQFTQQLEERLAQHFMGKRALLFNSGYMANLALLSTLPQRGDTIIYDSAIHACIKEGARLSSAKYYAFNHNDVRDLHRKLKNASGTLFVAIESLYSMEGDWAPIVDIIETCHQFNAQLLIDEAHTTGWCGAQGSSWSCSQGLQDDFLARVYTFGKAVGSHGACIVGDSVVIDYLINFARPFIYTTALPDITVATISCAWDYINNHPELSQQLIENINLYTKLAKEELQIPVNESSPIQSIPLAGNTEVIRLSNELQQLGFDVRPIRPPTVKAGKERLRICLHSFNTEEEISRLVEGLKQLLG